MTALYTRSIATPLGSITASASDTALVGIWFDGQKYFPADKPAWLSAPDHPLLNAAQDWLDAYFKGENKPIDFPLDPQGGSTFRRRVWDILRAIPHGTTTTYGAIAAQIARETGVKKVSAQAVGGAVGHNPISILIPCHRVVGSTGSLTGYAGGLDKKAALLKLEGILL
ncbi:MAG: methylated-DNA--[protein]-cysteine S-methyltransferase [Coriobacteriales bacterium]|jgi:methylated-DNA-[protein]-cysteine S-methyltransferase|nr:methylated-DNA--[protein]-cysteine S-methyltransferase [Coriobacteriales bacterium]